MHIAYLCKHPEHLPIVAQWHHQQWNYLSPSVSVEERLQRLTAQRGGLEIPTTCIALEDAEVVGCASLVAFDMDTRIDLSPWLASVFVEPSRRRQGIGSALVRRVVEEARALAVSRLHLYTPDRESFYSRLGWRRLGLEQFRGYKMVVMALDIE